MLKRVITIGIATVGIASLVGFSNTAEQQKGNFNEYLPYTITKDDNQVNVDVYQKIDNKNELNNYVSIANSNNEKAVGKFPNTEVPVTVTFKEPLALKEFKQFVNSTDINVEDYKIRAIENGTNELVTIGGAPIDNELVPENVLSEILEGSSFEGFIAVRGNIKLNQGNFNKLAINENVLLADLSTELIKDKVSKENDVNVSDIDKVEDVYWYHENY